MDKKFFQITKFYTVIDHRLESGYVFAGESHDFWEAGFVSSGSVEVTCNDGVYNLGVGDMIFYPPLSFHKINRVGSSGVRLLNISFMTSGTLPDGLPGNVFSLSSEECASFERTFQLISDTVKKRTEHPYVEQLASSRLSALMIELSFNHFAEERRLSSPSALEYRRTVSAMREKVYDNLSLTDFATSLHISVSYIKLLFNRYAGIGPKSFYSQLRLNTAKSLLKNGMSVSEVASVMNFSSHNYFARYFKQATGMTPSEYKRQY